MSCCVAGIGLKLASMVFVILPQLLSAGITGTCYVQCDPPSNCWIEKVGNSGLEYIVVSNIEDDAQESSVQCYSFSFLTDFFLWSSSVCLPCV